jgi:GNAT superfamily N-acetyltransferase
MTAPGADRELAIRPAEVADGGAICALAGELGYRLTPEEAGERLGRELRDPERTVLVAEAGGRRLVGWVQVVTFRSILAAPRAELAALVVTRERRGRGIGRLLVEAAVAWARAHGFATLQVRTNVAREAAPKFYEALGFERSKSQHVYTRTLGSGRE